MKTLIATLCILCFSIPALAETQEIKTQENLPRETKLYEKDYQNSWCSKHNGKTEVRLFDQTRIDCLTDSHAIEFDFASKWGESIGQSLYYATVVRKKPGIVLILNKGNNDNKYLQRVKTVANKYKITVWTMTPEDLTLSENQNK